MPNKTIAMMLTLAAAPAVSYAKKPHCPGLENIRRVGAEQESGTVLLQVDSLFKCHSDADSFDAAMAKLAGDLNAHRHKAFGIVSFGEDGYFAYVKAPYRVSAPVFFVQDDSSYACVTVQHTRNKCHAQSRPEQGDAQTDDAQSNSDNYSANDSQDPEQVDAPDGIAQWPSRLLEANFEASDDADDADKTDKGPVEQKRESDDYPKPKAPSDSGVSTRSDKDKDAKASDLPLHAGNVGLREVKAPPAENQPINLPEAKEQGLKSDDLPVYMHAGNIGLRKPQAPPKENQPNPEDHDS